jgi:hypothetical protein
MDNLGSSPIIFSASHSSSPYRALYSLATLERNHPGVLGVLKSRFLAPDRLKISQILGGGSAASVYLLETPEGFKTVLKVIPTDSNHSDEPMWETAATMISSDLGVSPKVECINRNFILMPYIGRAEKPFEGSWPLLDTEQSFKQILVKLSLLHRSSIIPCHKAKTNLDRLMCPATLAFIQMHPVLDHYFRKINSGYQAALSLTDKVTTFIHADITPLNIVENLTETYLIDWGVHPGEGNPYFDLGAVFAMYALEDDLKLALIREHYTGTITHKPPQDNQRLLKELNLFAGIYWLKLAVGAMLKAGISPEQVGNLSAIHDNANLVKKVSEKQVDLMIPAGQVELAKTAYWEAQKRVNAFVLGQDLSLSFRSMAL